MHVSPYTPTDLFKSTLDGRHPAAVAWQGLELQEEQFTVGAAHASVDAGVSV